MRVGDIVRRRPVTFYEKEDQGKSPRRILEGKVVYIHPLGLYHVVEFEIAGGKVRESFLRVED